MIYVLLATYYLLWALNIYLCLGKKEKKVIILLTWGFLYILFASNSAVQGDAYYYKLDYETGALGAKWAEAGYELLKLICKSLGLHSYNQFLIVLFALASILIFLGMKKLKGNYHVLFAMTMGFLFPAMAVAIRFFMSFAIFVFCLDYLIKGDHLKYIIGIVIAILFHRSALFFLVFLLSETVEKHTGKDKKKIDYIIGIIALGCALYTVIARRLPFISLITDTILKIFPNAGIKIDVYFSSFTRLGFMILVIVYIANYHLSRHLMISARSDQHDDRIVRLSSFGYTMNILTSVLLPLTIVNLVFFRLYIAQTFINGIVYGRLVEERMLYKRGILSLNTTELCFLFVIIAWLIPTVFQINSISISHLIMDSFFIG